MPLLFPTPEHAQQFARDLPTEAIGKQLDFRPRTDSTNDLALEAARAGAAHGTTFIADAQDRGRGRRGRQWQSPAGLGLLFSVLTRPEKIPATDSGWIPLLAGLACLDGIREATGLQAALKWPNDIVLPSTQAPGWRKLGGILCESTIPAKDDQVPSPGSRAAGAYVVIGIGINVNHSQAELPRITKAPPSSLRIELRRTLERTQVFRAILEALDRRLRGLEDPAQRAAQKSAVEDALREWWQPERVLSVRPGTEEDGAPLIEGRFQRLDEFGRLVLTDLHGDAVLLADAEIIGISR
jgi:BirA family biotin operon repressor/biotin-[acetyl-CoA-carboxylase] ligase